jgi:predicted DNA-binding WGR domain protein
MATRTASAPPSSAQGSASHGKAPQEHFLIFQEDEADKFWFARLEGSSWTAQWGRRGGKGQSKTYTFATPEKAQADFERKVSEKFAKGYCKAPEGAKAAEVEHKPSYHFRLVKKGEDQFGGMPPGVTEQSWPRCKECERPQQFLFMLHAHPERLPLKEHAAVAVFMCDGELSGGGCATYEPDSGANAVLLLSQKALASPALKQAPGGEKGSPEPLERRGFSYREKLEREPVDEENSDNNTDKVGGYPGWLQGAEFQNCRKCRKHMRFVAQLADQGEINFGDAGEAYLFVCPEEHEGRFLWQCC